ncbi:hypothetical protein SCLCIDRAFT_24934 [Scleroderma citrinum Foug A]|uniref:Uncharacterized protein n=1 Tax=Scleroderma citrinum Foug A TaxID=1036808 RepID=A0A0C3DPT9_9AGAM|nr:hypothetical protein SCLCIDRAFT_24934 [Scleroderma citrinum Foug A]
MPTLSANSDAHIAHHHHCHQQLGESGASIGFLHLSALAELHEHIISPIYRPPHTDLYNKSESSDAKPEGLHICPTVPPLCNNMEAAQSDRQISLMRKDLTYKIVHRNTIALQLNHIMLKWVEKDLRAVDKLVGHVRLMIRQSGHSAAFERFASRMGGLDDTASNAASTCFELTSPLLVVPSMPLLSLSQSPSPSPAPSTISPLTSGAIASTLLSTSPNASVWPSASTGAFHSMPGCFSFGCICHLRLHFDTVCVRMHAQGICAVSAAVWLIWALSCGSNSAFIGVNASISMFDTSQCLLDTSAWLLMPSVSPTPHFESPASSFVQHTRSIRLHSRSIHLAPQSIRLAAQHIRLTVRRIHLVSKSICMACPPTHASGVHMQYFTVVWDFQFDRQGYEHIQLV